MDLQAITQRLGGIGICKTAVDESYGTGKIAVFLSAANIIGQADVLES